ncbi:hypothetical protein EMPS_06486 [Entomortierella parvispora]|uniref:6-phosphogluconate dehydrogenase NADP-binding domain-containing protein n=1 Tax=Entomortierella parvispora TaxID=205924 RepID=A0A9P3HCT1_9FUNG|nr:hypothetical protein EMPS_06486 [Entomortierella parvispora]
MQSAQDKVGWIGLGALGFEMTQNLQKYLKSQSMPNLTVWNRTVEKSQKLAKINPEIQIASSIEDLYSRSNIIFTSLANDPAVEEVYEILIRCAETASNQLIFVETGTIYPELAISLKKRLSSLPKQHIYLQCPVFGRPEAAAAAQLLWVASGDAATIERLHPMFRSMSNRILDLKTEDVAAGCTMKLIGNFLMIAQTELIAESVNLARKSNLDTQHLLSFVETIMPAPIMVNLLQRTIAGEDAEEGVKTTLTIASKDLRCIDKWAQTQGAPLPTARTILDHFEVAKEKGYTKNWNFMIDSINHAAGSKEH